METSTGEKFGVSGFTNDWGFHLQESCAKPQNEKLIRRVSEFSNRPKPILDRFVSATSEHYFIMQRIMLSSHPVSNLVVHNWYWGRFTNYGKNDRRSPGGNLAVHTSTALSPALLRITPALRD